TSEPSPAVTLTPSQPGGRQPGGANDQPSRSLAVSQARLNEIVAPIIRGASVDRDLIARALDALREHNWASGFAFEGTSAPGWQLIAAFHVAAYAACAIEDDVLRWWRHNLRLPPYLKREQMPQGGWTETVAAGAVDLAATVAHVCELALSPDTRPAAR